MSSYEELERKAKNAIGDDEAKDFAMEDIDDAFYMGDIQDMQREQLIKLLAGISH